MKIYYVYKLQGVYTNLNASIAFCSNATSKIENCKQEMLLLRSKSAAEDLDEDF